MGTDSPAPRQPAPCGPLPGCGPVVETFPETLEPRDLGPLEEDLWLVPRRAGFAAAVGLIGATARQHPAGAPAAADDRKPAAPAPTRPRLRDRLDPRPRVRRLLATWRVGRLRAALPRLSAQLTSEVDAELTRIAAPAELTDRELLAALRWSRAILAAAHGQETLASALTAEPSERETIDRTPVALPPSAAARWVVRSEPHVALGPREALRLRARWVQELGAALAWEAGVRLHRAGTLTAPEDVRGLRLGELAAATTRAPVTVRAAAREVTLVEQRAAVRVA